MPRPIKKRAPKKKAPKEDNVKSAALQALDTLRQRQKKIIIAASVIIGIILIYVIFSLYTSSAAKKAYSLEMEAYNQYYAEISDTSLPAEEKWKKALELYRQSVDIKATPTAVFYLGNCYFNLADYENAVKEYNFFLDNFSRETGILPVVYQKLASAYFKTGQNDKALETLGRLSEVNNGIFRDTALILEARYYETAGEKDRALEKYRTLFTEYPYSPWSAEANAKVAAEEKTESGAASEKPQPEKAEAEEKQKE